MAKNYYISTLFWSTFQKLVGAIVGFVSVPLLLDYYGDADYGLLGLVTSCNGYMHLLDLGMNNGSVRFFSIWRASGKREHIHKVARTNISFYLIISLINALGLVVLAMFGADWFNVAQGQEDKFRDCMLILALFSVMSWGGTTFSQLLVAHQQMDFTMKFQTVMVLLRGGLVALVLLTDMPLTGYFALLTLVTSSLVVPYSVKCLREGYIDSLRPAAYWKDFKEILNFSLALFALTIFQSTATQMRPIILSAVDSAGTLRVAEFRIIEVVPTFVIMLGATFSGMFLPKTSEMVAKSDKEALASFAYKWTRVTSAFVCLCCFPFMLNADLFLSAYVGPEYAYLSKWLLLWCLTVLIQMHTTPGNSIVLAYGRTKELVVVTAIDCLVSIVVNALLCQYIQVGSAVVAYFIYVVVIIGLYYIYFYKKFFGLSRMRMALNFVLPTSIAVVCAIAVKALPDMELGRFLEGRWLYVAQFATDAVLWVLLYVGLTFGLKVIKVKELK